MDETAGVGAGDDADAFLDGELYAQDVNVHQRLGAHPDVGRADGAVEVVHLKGGRKEGSLVGHHFEHIGVGGQVAAVLDGAGAGADGDGQSGSADGVAQGAAAQGSGFVHQGFGFVQRVGLVQWAVAGATGGAAGGGELDLVGAAAYQFAHLGADAIHAVGDAVRGQRVMAEDSLAVAAAADLVLNAAGGGHDVDRYDEPGAFNQPLLDGHFEAGVQAAGVAHGGVAGGQRVLNHLGGADAEQRAGFIHAPAPGEAVAAGSEVVVDVNQAGHDGLPGGVQHFGTFGDGHGRARSGLDDTLTIDEHGGVGQGRRARTVNQIATNYSQHSDTPPGTRLFRWHYMPMRPARVWYYCRYAPPRYPYHQHFRRSRPA